jgi:PAS domain S-box-containing protein
MNEGFVLAEIVLDSSGKPYDFRYLEANPVFEQLTGMKASDIIGRTSREVLPRHDPTRFERYAKVAFSGKSLRFEDYLANLGKWFDMSVFQTDIGKFGVVFFDITERKLAEELLEQQVKEKTAQLRKLTSSWIQTQEEERELIALEVHDRCLQTMLSVYQQADRLQSMEIEGSDEQKAVDNLGKLTKQAISELRNIMKELYPEELKKFGLSALIEDELHRLKKETGCQYKTEIRCPKRLSVDIERTLYRIASEAITNIKRHATGVKSVFISLECKDDLILLNITDDGPGFKMGDKKRRKAPSGLVSMRRRAEIVGGTFKIRTSPGKGTIIQVRIPLESKQRKPASKR